MLVDACDPAPVAATVAEESTLDNPIWFALSAAHRHLARGDPSLALRYRADVSVLSGMATPSLDAYASLAQLTSPGSQVFLFLDKPFAETPCAPPGWAVDLALPIAQMVCRQLNYPPSMPGFQVLADEDIPAMMELTATTKPGPFSDRTKDMGFYIGLKDSDRLVAMAGERLHLDDYIEVSAVCTHPEYQGRGYAKALVAAVAREILRRGKTPILHVKTDNGSAIRVYQQLGFAQRRLIHFTILRRLLLEQ